MGQTQAKPSIMVLGSYHMGGRGDRDIHQFHNADELAEEQQRQIRECVDRLKAFQPTKVVVEFPADRADQLNSDYGQYKSRNFSLDSDEIHQLGFQIAAEQGHEKLYPVDWNRRIGGVALGHVYDFAKEAQPELYEQMKAAGDKRAAQIQKFMDNHTIREIFLHLNSAESLRQEKETYMRFARVSEGEYYIGADWLSDYWYRRNMMIFTNITRITSPEDRILVIYGSGHKHLIEQFIQESGLYELASVDAYLGGA